MTRVASSPGSAEPLAAMTRSEPRSWCAIDFAPSSSIRWSMTGTTTSAVAPCSSIACRVSCASKRRRRTSVEPSAIASTRCAKPQEWNIGAAIIVRSRARSGIDASSAAAGSSDAGCGRLAPFGAPVVPLVRMTTRPRDSGTATSAGSPVSMSCSTRGALERPPPSDQLTQLSRPAAASRATSARSSS